MEISDHVVIGSAGRAVARASRTGALLGVEAVPLTKKALGWNRKKRRRLFPIQWSEWRQGRM